MIFNVVPTTLEVALVCGLLASQFDASFAALTAATIVSYSLFTFQTTAVRLSHAQRVRVFSCVTWNALS